MPLSQKEIENIKKQLKEQAQNFPPEKKEEAINYINSMSDQEVEEFLKQNKQQTQCIFCSIAQKQTPSFSIAEDKNHIAVLDINPLSKGHSLVLPKQHVQETEKEAKKFAETIAQKIHEKFSPKQIKINPLNVMDHAALEVLPLYGDETERKKASEEELLEIKKQIEKKPTKPRKKSAKITKKKTASGLPQVPPRIP